MSDDQSCLACGKALPDNFEELETCPHCGTDLWDDDGQGDGGQGDGLGGIDGKIIGAGLVAAAIGVALWAAVAIGLNREIGWLAWGIGGLIGFGVTKAGGI
ncbi:MAG: hypothetical protein P1V35_13910, partial [Planctomycetota bacterium]|nr:hypothetical protein [Planctomycetota bacterium]